MTKPSIIVRLAGPGAEKSLPLFQSDAFELTTAPVDPASPARKVLVAFRPPRDEDLSIYEWVHVAGAGSDKVAAALQADGADPLMTRTVGRMGEQIGEYVLSYILADLQRHTERQRLQAEGEWSIAKAEGQFLFDKNVAILGTGGVAQGIAGVLQPLAKTVTGYSRRAEARPGFDNVFALTDFQGADFLVNALPATTATDEICNASLFEQMQGGVLINIGRGRTLHDNDLLAALDQGTLRHAVLDVFREEPLQASSAFWTHPKITVTPHVSGITRWEDTAQAFLSYWPAFAGGALTSTVDLAQGY